MCQAEIPPPTHDGPSQEQREGVSRTRSWQAARPHNTHTIHGLLKEGLQGAQVRPRSRRRRLRSGGAAATATSVSGGNCQGGRKESSGGSSHWRKDTPALPRAPPPPAPGPSSLPSPSAPPGRRTCSRPAAPAAAPAAPAPPRPSRPPPSCAAEHAGWGARTATTARPIGGKRRGAAGGSATAIGPREPPSQSEAKGGLAFSPSGGREEQRGHGWRMRSCARTSPASARRQATPTGRGGGGAAVRGGGGGAAPFPFPAGRGPCRSSRRWGCTESAWWEKTFEITESGLHRVS